MPVLVDSVMRSGSNGAMVSKSPKTFRRPLLG